MNSSNTVKIILFSIITVLFIAIIGTILAGDGLNGWYKTLKMPFINIPFWLFIIIQIIYYLICIIILSRILFIIKERNKLITILSIFFIFMLTAELWNFFFIGLKNINNGFIGMIIFTLLSILLFIILYKNERTSSYFLLPYLIWLVFDNIWIYDLWRINN